MSSETIKPYVIFEKNSENFSITYTLSGASYASTGITIEPYREGGLLVFLKKSGFMNKDLAKLHNFCLYCNDKGEILESSGTHSMDCGVYAERVFLYLASMENSTDVFYLSLLSNFLEKDIASVELRDDEACRLAIKINEMINGTGCGVLLLECVGHMSVVCKKNENLFIFDSLGRESSHKKIYDFMIDTERKAEILNEENLQKLCIGRYVVDAGFCGFAALKFADSFIKSNGNASLIEVRAFIESLKESIKKNKKEEAEKLLSEQFTVQQRTQQKSGVKKKAIRGK